MTQEKSSDPLAPPDPPCPPPPTLHKFQDNINHFLRLQQPFIFKRLSFQNIWLDILIWPIRYSPKTDGGNPKLLLILAKLERLQTPHGYTQGDNPKESRQYSDSFNYISHAQDNSDKPEKILTVILK